MLIPDSVLYEATVKAGAPGSDSIAAWVQNTSDLVRPIVTETSANFLSARESNPAHRERDLGDRAAVEAIRYGISLSADERALLITEDDRALRGSFVMTIEDRQRLIPLTTFDFLAALEGAGRINSVEEVYRSAETAGRSASRHAILSEENRDARASVDRLLQRKV